jgi:ADP-ribosyl-[dinitrogen reductase] hydrolase
MNETIAERLRGIAVGAAVGDALGMPLEFGLASHPKRFIRKMCAGRLPAGSFTDDTEMALALAESLLANPELNADDLTGRFLGWYHSDPPDIGIHTSLVLERLASGEPWKTAAAEVQSRDPGNAGNGSVMRSWPVAIACFFDPSDVLIKFSRLQSSITHIHEECTAGCAFINQMIVALGKDMPPSDAYQLALNTTPMPEGLRQAILLAPHRKRDELRNTGWVRHTIESALWGLMNTDSFEEALIQVINLGADADTAGAVTGALAGAAYGLAAIPPDWVSALHGEWPLGSKSVWQSINLTDLADSLIGCRNAEARQVKPKGGKDS